MSSPAIQSSRVDMCRDDHVPALMKFINDSWAKDHVLSRDEALLRWQYDASLNERHDDEAPVSVLLAWHEDRIVGMLGLTHMRWYHRGCIYPGAWNSHWFVVPELRASHLPLLLIRRGAQAGAAVIGSVGLNDIAVRVLSHIGYEIIREIPRWVAIFDPLKTAALIADADGEPSDPEALLRYCHERAVSPSLTPSSMQSWEAIQWRDDLADDWDASWECSISVGFTGVARDSAYLRWRYVRHPTFGYRVLMARHRRSREIGGIAVSRLETVKGRTERVLRVLDLLAADRGAGDCLIAGLTQSAHRDGVAFADFYCTKAIEGLAERGFQIEQLSNNPYPIPFRLQPLEAGGRPLNAALRLPVPLRGTLAELFARGELYLTKSDGDQDRPN